MSDYERGFFDGIECAAQAAEDYYPSIITCHKEFDDEKDKIEHVRLHVETKWCQSIAKHIRQQKP